MWQGVAGGREGTQAGVPAKTTKGKKNSGETVQGWSWVQVGGRQPGKCREHWKGATTCASLRRR